MQISKSPWRLFSLASSFPDLPTVQFLISCKNYSIARWSKTGQWEGLGMRPPFPIKWPICGLKSLRYGFLSVLSFCFWCFEKFRPAKWKCHQTTTKGRMQHQSDIPTLLISVATIWKGRASKSMNFNSTITGTHSRSESAHAIGNSRFSNFNPLSLAFNSKLSMNWQHTTNDPNTNQTSHWLGDWIIDSGLWLNVTLLTTAKRG